ncbi:MAG: SpoIIE family protein phosphatase [Pseudomonadota bacterium]
MSKHTTTKPTVLVADDSRTQRLLLRTLLKQEGYSVVEASDGAEALEILRRKPINMVLTDWMMPGLTGPELCRAIRADRGDEGDYVYAILLTARHDTADLSAGLEAGADDFLTKPVDKIELIARLDSGTRILNMHARLLDQQKELGRLVGELEASHAEIERDLKIAGVLQEETVPPAFDHCNGAPIAAYHKAMHHVGGDLIGSFPIGAHGVGMFSIDVAGHGVAPALRGAHLAQLLSRPEESEHLAFAQCTESGSTILDPGPIVAELNRRFATTTEHELYFTMAIITLDLVSGEGLYCRAGHRPPLIQRRDGTIEALLQGGPPVGLLQAIPYAAYPFRLAEGERLFLYSDGIIEPERPDGSMIEVEGLSQIIGTLADRPADAVLEAVIEQVLVETNHVPFDDDISAILLERPQVAQLSPAAQMAAKASNERSSNVPTAAAS